MDPNYESPFSLDVSKLPSRKLSSQFCMAFDLATPPRGIPLKNQNEI